MENTKKSYKCVVPTLITIGPCGLAKPSKAMPLWGTVLLETPKRETNSMARVCWSARGCVVAWLRAMRGWQHWNCIDRWSINMWSIKMWPINTWSIKMWSINMWSINMWSINTWSIKMWSIKMWQRGREEGGAFYGWNLATCIYYIRYVNTCAEHGSCSRTSIQREYVNESMNLQLLHHM